MAGTTSMNMIQQKIWDGRLPLEITLVASECRTFDELDPYLISCPRLSYLPLLLPRLHSFFRSSLIDPSTSPSCGWFSFEDVPLKWHVPIGLLYDLYSPAEPFTPVTDSTLATSTSLPFKLMLHFTSWPDDQLVALDEDFIAMHDAFTNSVKEADFLRSGTAKPIMTLSKADSSALWDSVKDHNLVTHQRILNILLPPLTSNFRNVPLRIYMPSPDPEGPAIKTLQGLVPPTIPGPTGRGQIQTLGGALNSLAPSLFPSKRVSVLARPVVQGVVVPMTAHVEELCRTAAYSDGWLCIVVRMVS